VKGKRQRAKCSSTNSLTKVMLVNQSIMKLNHYEQEFFTFFVTIFNVSVSCFQAGIGNAIRAHSFNILFSV